ncbi:MAG TPA: tetratricopeptide repeat protein [Promineifilum sp.]|nr:tetratricopeptide repeat protein [Promineifilum sp.]HRQ13281.1 tetratricopeptide repeat protein [Promineifilum sp.]
MRSNPYTSTHTVRLIGGAILVASLIVAFGARIISLAYQNGANIRLNTALAYGDSVALEDSAHELTGVLTLSPEEQIAWRGIALVRMTQGKLNEVAAAYLHVNNYRAELLDWGARAETQRQWAKAQDWYRVAILLEPENGDHYYRLARISAEQGESEAKAYYVQALSAPRHTEFGRSNILTRLGELEKRKSSTDWNEVLARFDEAIQLNEFVDQQDIIQARSNKAEALDRLGKYRAALDEYESLAGDYPGNYWANVHSGRLVWQLKSDAPTAIAYLEKAIQNNDKPKWAYLLLAQIHAQSGNPELAIPLFRKVLTIDPGDRAAREQLDKLTGGDGS